MSETVHEEKKSLGKYWLFTLISLVGVIALLIIIPEWFWLGLPFLGTSFALAMDWL